MCSKQLRIFLELYYLNYGPWFISISFTSVFVRDKLLVIISQYIQNQIIMLYIKTNAMLYINFISMNINKQNYPEVWKIPGKQEAIIRSKCWEKDLIAYWGTYSYTQCGHECGLNIIWQDIPYEWNNSNIIIFRKGETI